MKYSDPVKAVRVVRVHSHLDDELGTQGMGLGLSIVRECMDAMSGAGATWHAS